MGAVYEAYDNRLNNRVAVKESLIHDEAYHRAFEKEAQRLARLYHPALPSVIDHFVEAQGEQPVLTPYFVMRYIEGQDLDGLLKERQGRPFPLSELLAWADQLLDLLTYLHSQTPPLIHRDIKPANLKLTEQGQIILLDFGLAKGGLSQQTVGLALPGYTLDYAPPEQLANKATDARSDLYALGATLYTLLTGEVPENAPTRIHERFQGRSDPLWPPNQLNPEIPPHVAQTLTRALALEPAKRPLNAAQMRAMLKGELSPSDGTIPPTFAVPVLREEPPISKSEAATRLNRSLEPTPRNADLPPPAPTREWQASASTPVEEPSGRRSSPLFAAAVIILLIIVCAVATLLGRYVAQTGIGSSSSPTIISSLPTFTPAAISPTPEAISPTPEAISNSPTPLPSVTAPTPSAREATATPSSLPIEGLRRVGNGSDLVALPASSSITVDGELSEWAAEAGTLPSEGISISNVVFQPENWQGKQDLSGVVRAAYDEQFLYLAVRVLDDVMVQESADRFLHRGDAVEFFWDLALAEDFAQESYSQDDAQMVFSPGNFAGNRPSSWVHSSPTGNFRDKILVASSQRADGYDIEIAIPWASLNLSPRPGAIFGYAVALSDDDSPGGGEQQTQLSTSPQAPFQYPARWGNLILE
jgi:serine/threonine protein kinase